MPWEAFHLVLEYALERDRWVKCSDRYVATYALCGVNRCAFDLCLEASMRRQRHASARSSIAPAHCRAVFVANAAHYWRTRHNDQSAFRAWLARQSPALLRLDFDNPSPH